MERTYQRPMAESLLFRPAEVLTSSRVPGQPPRENETPVRPLP